MITNLAAINPPLKKKVDYWQEAKSYAETLSLEDTVYSEPQGIQMAITMQSFNFLKRYIPKLAIFNDLLIIYYDNKGAIQKVVPDDFVVIGAREKKDRYSYIIDITEDTNIPLIVMEYVSLSSLERNSIDKYKIYEREIKIPYYLYFDLDKRELTIYKRKNKSYTKLNKNEKERWVIEELGIEIGLYQGFVRYYWRDEIILVGEEIADLIEKYTFRIKSLSQQKEEAVENMKSALKREAIAIKREADALQEKNSAMKREADALQEKNNALQEKNAAMKREADAVTSLKRMIKFLAVEKQKEDLLISINEINDLEILNKIFDELTKK